MKKSNSHRFTLFIMIIIIVFFIVYFFIPFLGNGFLTRIFTPLCYIQQIYQGDQYVPVWCSDIEKAKVEEVKDKLQNTNSSINGNLNKNEEPQEPVVIEEPVQEPDNITSSPADNEPVDLSGSVSFEQPSEISVAEPQDNAQLSSPFTVSGNADGISGDEVYFRVTGLNNNVLIEESDKIDSNGDFKIEISYEFSLTKEGYVEVYSKSASGSEENLVRIPVKF